MRIGSSLVIATLLVCGIAVEAEAQLAARVYATGFTQPVGFVQDPANRSVQYVVEQIGRIRVIRNGVLLAAPFLDLTMANALSSGGERGMLGLAFAPDYATSGRAFVDFTDLAGNTVVARFTRSSADPLVLNPSSRFDLRWNGVSGDAFITQPYANHNGGNLVFGPDGFLYIGLGDGGSGDDPENRAQNPSELLGKMLRIDVAVPDNDPIGYRVPPDNPFVASGPIGVRAEIWSFGLRNPWRYSFDSPARGGTAALVMADVGQNQYEEIDYEPAGRGGRNYGWRIGEASHDNVTSRPAAFLPLTEPIYEYDHGTGQSITGGFVYRGRALGSIYQGRYFFADYVAARVWSIGLTIDSSSGEASVTDRIEHTTELGGLGGVTSFGVDADGELYIVSYTGMVLQLLGTATSPIITTQPSSVTVAGRQNAQFTVAATGAPVPHYQWQRSTNGGSSWNTLLDGGPYSGASTAVLTVSATTGMNGFQFRCVASSSAGAATSHAVVLTVSGSVGGPSGNP